MKRNQIDQGNVYSSIGRSNQNPHDDINILEPDPDSDMLLIGDEDEDLLDFSLMNTAYDPEYDK